MRILFRGTIQDDDTLILVSESDVEAELLMKLGEMDAKIIGYTPPTEFSNWSVSDQKGRVIESGKRAQIQILFSDRKPWKAHPLRGRSRGDLRLQLATGTTDEVMEAITEIVRRGGLLDEA